MQYEIEIVGGEQGETILFTLDPNVTNCRLTCEVRGEVHVADESDYFAALCQIRRRVLEPMGMFPVCYGASLTHWPSAMSRDMGRGLKVYKMEHGGPAREIVETFEAGPNITVSSVEAQEKFAKYVIYGKSKSDPSGLLGRIFPKYKS